MGLAKRCGAVGTRLQSGPPHYARLSLQVYRLAPGLSWRLIGQALPGWWRGRALPK